MPIRFQCEHCRQTLSAPSNKAGARVRCPACKEPTIVPRSEAEAPAPPAVTKEIPRERIGGVLPSESSPPGERTEIDWDAASPEETLPDLPLPEPEPHTEPPQDPEPQGRVARPPRDTEPPDVEVGSGGFSKRRGDDEEEMDLTPMVDVVFLLLIFFMITASFSRQKSLEVPPPDPEKKGAQQSPDFQDDLEDISIVVTIDEQDQVRVEDELVADLTQLGDVLQDRRRKDDKHELLLTPSDECRHETVVKVLDAAQDVGLQRIRMTSGGEE